MKHFGTDGIRLKAEKFTEEYLTKIALGIAYLPHCDKVIIGRDPRESGERMEKTLARVISENGAEVLLAGMVPTPCLAYLTEFYGCDYGIMLSASHNPPEYNGVKLFDCNGCKVSGETEEAVEKSIDSGIMLLRYTASVIKRVDGAKHYEDYLLEKIDPNFAGMKIVLDCSNGATSLIAPEAFTRAGAEVFPFYTETDGKNINLHCGATVPETLVKLTEKNECDIAFTFDGDGDRLMCVQNGKIFNGDHLMYVHAKALKGQGKLVKNTMVGTVMSNMGTEIACLNAGINLVRTQVGDKYVHREMEKFGYNLGGEESGHVIFSDYMPTGDGICAALLTAKLNKIKRIAEEDDIVEFPSVGDAVVCSPEGMEKFRNDGEISEYIKNIGKEFRTVIRPSGTEPKIRILVECADGAKAKEKAAEIKKFIEERIL